MAKAREPKVFRSMDDLPLMLTPYSCRYSGQLTGYLYIPRRTTRLRTEAFYNPGS